MTSLILQLFRVYVEWWLGVWRDSPLHVIVETGLLILIGYILVIRRRSTPPAVVLSEKEVEELVQDWQPEPLGALRDMGAVQPRGTRAAYALSPFSVPATSASAAPPFEFVVDGFAPEDPRHLTVCLQGPEVRRATTFCSMDFLGLGAALRVRTAATAALDEYTLGSCGPRGFYGTTRKHLELEACLARFAGTPDAISYSDATATVASTIPAFAKRGDVLVVDEGCSYGVMIGARLSRARVVTWRHNDVTDLARHLVSVDAADHAFASTQRRFIVVEGLYADSGDLAPLVEVVQLARRHCWRVIVDDSCGFGVLGATGRGTVEHLGLVSADVDVLVGSLSTAFASVGGFCVGSREVVDHQRLSGAGYCFSASEPPFLCATVAAAVAEVDERGGELLPALRSRTEAVHRALAARVPHLRVVSSPVSPVQHLVLPARAAASSLGSAAAVAREILRRCADSGVLLSRSHAVPPITRPPVTIRVCVTVAHTDDEVEKMVDTLSTVVRSIFGDAPSSSSSG